MMRHRRPSPAMVVALGAVVIGLGGVAFATIPNSSGTIHACAHKQSGALRVVESADGCRPAEQALSWNADRAGGVRIVTRIKSERPVTVRGDETVRIPLTGNTWEQAAGEFQEIRHQVVQEGSTCLGQAVIEVTNPLLNLPAAQTFDVIPSPDRTVLFVGGRELGAPDQPVQHSLNIDLRRRSFCGEGESVTVHSVEMVVIAYG